MSDPTFTSSFLLTSDSDLTFAQTVSRATPLTRLLNESWYFLSATAMASFSQQGFSAERGDKFKPFKSFSTPVDDSKTPPKGTVQGSIWNFLRFLFRTWGDAFMSVPHSWTDPTVIWTTFLYARTTTVILFFVLVLDVAIKLPRGRRLYEKLTENKLGLTLVNSCEFNLDASVQTYRACA